MITMRKIIPYCTILITGLSLVRKINILLCKTGKVYILHAKHTFPFVVYIFLNARLIQQLMMKLMMALMTIALMKVILMYSLKYFKHYCLWILFKNALPFMRTRKFDLNVERSYFFHLLSVILFLYFCFKFRLSYSICQNFVR